MPTGERLQLTSDKQRDVAVMLQQAIAQAEDDRAHLLKSVRDWRDQYAQDMKKRNPDKPFPGAASITLPITTTACDATKDRLSKAIFSVEPYFIVGGRNRQADLRGQQLEKWLDWRSKWALNLKAVMDDGFGRVLQDGVAWAVLKYVERKQPVVSRNMVQSREPLLNQMTGEPIVLGGQQRYSYGTKEVEQETEVVSYRGPVLTIEPIEDVGVFPAKASTSDEVTGFYRIIRKRMDDWRADARAGRYQNVEELANKDNTDSVLQEQRQRHAGTDGNSPPMTDGAQIVEAYECLWKWEHRGKRGWYVFTVACNAPVLLRASTFPYWHQRPYIIPLRAMPRSGSFYGWSIPEMLRQLQLTGNALVRQYLDAGRLANSPTITAPRQAGYRWQKYQIEVGNINYFDRPDGVQHLTFPGPTNHALEGLAFIDKFAQRVSALSDLSLGGMPTQEVKATEVNASMAGGNIKFEQMMHRLQYGSGTIGSGEGLNEIALQCLALDYQYEGSGPLPERILGINPFSGLDMESLLFGYDVYARGSTSAENKALDKQERMAFANWLSQHPMFAQLVMSNPEGAYNLLEWVTEPHDEVKSIEAFVGTKQQVAQNLAQMQQQQQQMMQAQEQAMQQQLAAEQEKAQGELALKSRKEDREDMRLMVDARAKGEDMKTKLEVAELSAKARATAGRD